MTIRSKLLLVFSLTIMVTITPLVVLLYFQSQLVNKYDRTVENLLRVHTLSDLSEDTVFTYLEYYKNVDNEKIATEYNDDIKGINDQFDVLDNEFKNHDTQVVYTGLKNSIVSIINIVERGLRAAKSGDISVASKQYDTAYNHIAFVEENTSKVLSEELSRISDYQKQLNTQKNLIIVASIITTIVILVTGSYIAMVYSRNLTRPLVSLASISSRVAGGDLDTKIGKDMLDQDDEVGILSKSFQHMIMQLKVYINKIQLSNEDLKKTQSNLKETNLELVNINKLMIGREIKMTELKKEIENLKASS